jgi:hypothetical protein
MNLIKATALLYFSAAISVTNIYAQLTDFASTNFDKADSLADLYSDYQLTDLKSLADNLTKPLDTEQEKFRAIYKWVCNNIHYDYALLLKQKNAKEKIKDKEVLKQWNHEFSKQLFDVLLNEHATICTGYTYIIRELCVHAGLKCEMVDGYARISQTKKMENANHSWNAIQLNNKWYLCDPTWSSGNYDLATSQFIKRYDDSYFLTDPSIFVHKHFPLDERWLLLPDKPSLEDFLNGPVIYSGASKYRITKFIPATFNVTASKGKTITFKFNCKSKELIKPELRINQSDSTYSCIPISYKDQNGLQCIDHIFERKGTYVVHILLSDNYILTYRVKIG